MSTIEAVYRRGVFEPLEPVGDLQDEQRVRLSIQPSEQKAIADWLERAKELQAGIIKRAGVLPDSTPGIAEDRRR